MPYWLWSALHLIGVTAFFSNAVAALFWKHRADRRGDPLVITHTFQGLMAADRSITPVSVSLIVLGGIGAAAKTGLPILGTGWILWSLALFGCSGVLFALGALPTQRRLADWTSRAVGRESFDWERYRRESRAWAIWAHLSLLCALAAFLLMVWKPGLPSF